MMQNNYKRIWCLVLCVLCLVGCRQKPEVKEGDYEVYYLDAEELIFVTEGYDIPESDARKQIQSLLEKLKEDPENTRLKSTIPEDVVVENWIFENGELNLYFNEAYLDMDRETELVLRAAMVKTLVQIKAVSGIEFYVGEQPLTYADGDVVGRMTGDDFVRNVGSSLHSYLSTELTLYVANKDGDKLTPKKVKVRYNSNTSKEKLIVEQLIKLSGKSAGGTASGAVLPPETVLLGVSVKDDICYVNFDEGFLNMTEINPEITIYALVNSIVDGGNASQVQILVNGESNMNYQGSVDLSKPLLKNMEIVEESDD